MGFVQSIDTAREATISRAGVASPYTQALGRTREALDALRAGYTDGSLRLLRIAAERNDLVAINDAARRISAGATDILILGTGGSSLGGQTLAQLAGYAVPGLGTLRERPRLHFIDNLDPHTFGMLLAKLPLASTRFIAISKSGSTGETLMQTMAALAAVRDAGLSARIPELFLGLTEPLNGEKRSSLRALFEHYGVSMLEHDAGVGGRFSVLTNVGLLPAAILGLDLAAIRSGAATALAPVLAGRVPAEVPAAVGAALAAALAPTKPITVMLAYADRLERFTRWFVQLWAESLGKNGKGTTPVAALGPRDQHSQLQLFLAGPRDKLFSVLTVATAGTGSRIPPDLAKLAGEPDYAGKTTGDLVAAQARATIEMLVENGCPVRTIQIDRLDEANLGALLMHFMLESIITAHLLGIDPFDQPAVEQGKSLAKRYLAGSG